MKTMTRRGGLAVLFLGLALAGFNCRTAPDRPAGQGRHSREYSSHCSSSPDSSQSW